MTKKKTVVFMSAKSAACCRRMLAPVVWVLLVFEGSMRGSCGSVGYDGEGCGKGS
jgi:hypothetical protein